VTIGSVRTTVTVALTPHEAFDVFTAEMPAWYRRGAASLGRRHGEATLRLEPKVGGRVLRTGPDGVDVAIGRVTAWDPGRRLCFVDQHDTEVEVRFETDGDGTRVVLEHGGLDRLPDDVAASLAQYGWRRLALWFEAHQQTKERR
jgi:hypothetical protein